MPQSSSSSRNASGLSALASQFGIGVTTGEPAQSPQFYAELLTSRELMGRLVADTFAVADGTRGTLADLLAIRDDDPAKRREQTLATLAGRISTSVTRETGMVRLQVRTPWPDLSAAVADRLIALVNEFNLETRRSSAASVVRFVEEWLKDAEASLRSAEGEFRDFLEANRQFERSPQLVFENDRLQRLVAQRQQIYTDLQQSLENARIMQVRDTPVITVVERPEAPVYPDSRGVVLRVLLGLAIGAVAGIVIGLVREGIRNAAAGDDPEYQKLRDTWGQAVGDLQRGRRRPGGRGEQEPPQLANPEPS
jgi:uncharacterized protein involved in exopolysaccharide biosynthesis